MHANNEVGTIQPVREIALIAKEYGIVLHSDTVQTVGKVPVDVNDLHVDLLSISAHKMYGPKGIGAIYIRKGTNIDALIHGGAQERKNRAGTENIPSIVGFAKAMEIASNEWSDNFEHARLCKELLKAKICGELKNVVVNGGEQDTLPFILNVSLDSSSYEAERESLLLNLDLHGVAVSSGSACTSGSVQPSHVLLAMGRDERSTSTAIRFSFGKFTSVKDVDRAGDVFCSIVRSLPKRPAVVH
ncbi:MAG: cysteine desulfurase, partial [Ignavibacteriales bacterium]|nr:cysteine desulfurase [Ignavibacteriales bacterium]